MTRFEIIGNKIISESPFNTHTFEIVEKIPAGFYVWNIGKNMGSDEYIPLAEDLNPNHKENFEINQMRKGHGKAKEKAISQTIKEKPPPQQFKFSKKLQYNIYPLLQFKLAKRITQCYNQLVKGIL